MDFVAKLTKADYNTFVETMFNHYGLSNQIAIKYLTYLKSGVFITKFLVENKEEVFLFSDQSFKIKNLESFAQKLDFASEDLKEILKLEWQGFMIAKFGAEYIAKKMIFSPSQTRIFKYVGKYSQTLSASKKESQSLVKNY